MELNNIFKNTVVLSLPHRLDRQNQVKLDLKKINIKWSFFEAINGHELTVRTMPELLPGEEGIKLSHIKILEYAKQQNLDSIFIFEDDVELDIDVLPKLKQMSNVSENCELLYLGGHHREPIYHVNQNIYKTLSTYTTHAMWIKNTLFDKALERIKTLNNQQLDNCYVSLQKEHNTYTFYPAIAWQSNDYSDIQNKFINYNWLKN